jgi:L-fuconolactonase
MGPNEPDAISAPARRSATIVDSHAHVWAMDPDAYPWQPTQGYIPSEPASPDVLLAAMDNVGANHAILVQPSVYGPDHRFLFNTVRAHPDRFLPVGVVDPAEETAGATARSLVKDDGCVGLRVNLSLDVQRAAVQAHAPSWAELEALEVPMCVRATPAHHDLVKEILAGHDRARFVVDHLGLPEAGQSEATIARLSELARFAHCWLKVAGLTRFSGSAVPYRDVWPVLEAALRLFGASRMLWGSDFPFVDPKGGYEAPLRVIQSIPSVSAGDRHQLMGTTACELWGIPR